MSLPHVLQSPAYRARLDNWLQHAGVRSWSIPRHHDGSRFLPFSPDFVPLASHPLVRDRGGAVIHQVLGQHLLHFCVFTEHLELEAVVPACTRLRFGRVPFSVPAGLAQDAGRVVVDETWHAECSSDLKGEMMRATGVTPGRDRDPAFLQELRRLKETLSGHHQVLADQAFTYVSETLITGTLTRVPNDGRVQPAVRAGLREHAREEAFHHSIFGQAIGVMWSQLPPADRDVAGPLFAKMIAIFLRPDTLAELDGLEAAGFTASEAKRIVEETYEGPVGRAPWQCAAPTVGFMRQHGLLDHAATRETLEKMEFLRPGAAGGVAP